jgi:hypothetical protein
LIKGSANDTTGKMINGIPENIKFLQHFGVETSDAFAWVKFQFDYANEVSGFPRRWLKWQKKAHEKLSSYIKLGTLHPGSVFDNLTFE